MQELIVIDIDAEGEIEPSITLIDDFEVMELC